MRATSGTALYDAVGTAHEYLTKNASSETINAIILLTDGLNTESLGKRGALLERINTTRHGPPTIRIFCIGYGLGELTVKEQADAAR